MDFTPYLDILADELNMLYLNGVKVVHATTSETFMCRAMLLTIVTDYRGMAEIFRITQSPALIGACYICGVEGWRMATKTCYSGEHSHRHDVLHMGMCTCVYSFRCLVTHVGYWRWLPSSDASLRQKGSSINGKLPPDATASAYKTSDELRSFAQEADGDLARGAPPCSPCST